MQFRCHSLRYSITQCFLVYVVVSLFTSESAVGSQTGPEKKIILNICYEETEVFPNFMGQGAQVAESNPGLIIDLLKIMDKELPWVKARFHRAAWSRCLKKLAQGEFNAVVAGYEPERAQYAVYPMKNGVPDISMAVSKANFCLFSQKNSQFQWHGDRFIGSQKTALVIPRGYSLVSLLERHGIIFELTFSSKLAMELLMGGRVENAITLCSTGQHFINQHHAQGLMAPSQVIRTQFAYLAVNKAFFNAHKNEIEQVWVSLVKNREAHFETLLKRYLALQRN